ncbi:MAG: acylphosphatase [Methanospirillum sp.]|uniref:acylphosphatase n=1 Tax=Methanospirillum sp. TaxID=45200 RepID=UPI002370E792|nr:acylphosphatase [Methanospirillum sp.]MDD1729032.1 acylphosphatase [Methanospirillum sp.]
MRRVVLIVHGDVQRVGYRDRVHKIANKGGIYGQIRNLDELDAEIIAEGKSENIEQFISDIRISEYPISVESVEIREEVYTGSVSSFRIIRGDPDEELAERMDTAIQHLSIIGHYSKRASDNSDVLISMMETSIGKQDQMLDKQDQMLEKQDQMLGKQDQMIVNQDNVLQEIKGVRSDLKKTVTQEVSEMRIELREVREALVRAGLMEPAKG